MISNLFGISDKTWIFINTFAPWFSAIGTVSAVIVSLYLARKSKPKLTVRVGHRIIITPGMKGPFPEYVAFSITNIGGRILKITNLGWKIGLFRWKIDLLKEKTAIQPTIRDELSNTIPIDLKDGEMANYFIELKDDKNWIKHFAKDFIESKSRILLLTLRFEVYTSIGRTFSCKVEKPLLQMLIKEIDNQPKAPVTQT